MDRWYNITSKTDGSKKMEPKKSPIFISFRFQNRIDPATYYSRGA